MGLGKLKERLNVVRKKLYGNGQQNYTEHFSNDVYAVLTNNSLDFRRCFQNNKNNNNIDYNRKDYVFRSEFGP